MVNPGSINKRIASKKTGRLWRTGGGDANGHKDDSRADCEP
jgi:hypothetical protein